MFKQAEDLKLIGQKVISMFDKFENLEDINIAYLWSDKQKKKGTNTVYGDCEKVSDKHKALSGYDFCITFYADAENLNEETKEHLMEHELMHIGIDEDGKHSIVQHDLEDFKEIIDKYGTNWIEK